MPTAASWDSVLLGGPGEKRAVRRPSLKLSELSEPTVVLSSPAGPSIDQCQDLAATSSVRPAARGCIVQALCGSTTSTVKLSALCRAPADLVPLVAMPANTSAASCSGSALLHVLDGAGVLTRIRRLRGGAQASASHKSRDRELHL